MYKTLISVNDPEVIKQRKIDKDVFKKEIENFCEDYTKTFIDENDKKNTTSSPLSRPSLVDGGGGQVEIRDS